MKTILGRLLVVCLVVTLVVPLLPFSAISSSMTPDDMRLISGGKVAIDCNAAATAVQVFCIIAGGGSTTCSIVYALAYVGCLVSQII